jgi:hypothetical protein
MISILQSLDLRQRAQGGWVQELPSVAAGWTQIRDMPEPAERTFHQMWKTREKK